MQEITKAHILQEIQDKFKLRELAPEKFSFQESVVPVYNIEQHLEVPEIMAATKSITATGTMYFFSVPPNQRWRLHAYNVIFMTGAFTIAGVMITRPTISNWIYLNLAPAIAASYAYNLPKDITLNAGEDISVNVDGYTSTGNLQMLIDVTVEEIR